MRTRFLLIIFLVLSLTALSVSLVHAYFSRIERYNLIDHQIEQTAAVLISSDLTYRKIDDSGEVDDVILDILGKTAINLVVLVRDQEGNVLLENENAEILKTSLSWEEQWQDLEIESHLVRILTLKLPKRQRILQVGMVMNHNMVRWRDLNQRVLAYVLGIFAAVFLVSVFLRSLLMRPLDRLTEHLRRLTLNLDNGLIELEATAVIGAAPIGGSFGVLASLQRNDEFGNLLSAVSELSLKVSENLRSAKLWTAKMAHETKTPLTIIRSSLETLLPKLALPGKREELERSIAELDHLSSSIDEFLSWSAVESELPGSQELHAIKLQNFVATAVESLRAAFPGRIELLGESSFTVFSKPTHLQQLINNLVTNALKYSSPAKPVTVRLTDGAFAVEDHGPGIPSEVLARIGKPFNRALSQGGERAGNGLGLAWVSTVCKKYGWTLDIKTDSDGTRIRVLFPTDP